MMFADHKQVRAEFLCLLYHHVADWPLDDKRAINPNTAGA